MIIARCDCCGLEVKDFNSLDVDLYDEPNPRAMLKNHVRLEAQLCPTCYCLLSELIKTKLRTAEVTINPFG